MIGLALAAAGIRVMAPAETECSKRKGQRSARGTEEINSSCSGTTADILWNTPALPESCKTLRYQGGVLPGVREEQKKDKDCSWDSETDSKGQGKVSADPTLPAAVGKTLDARSVGVEHGKGALPAAEEQKEDSDSPWDSETDSKGQGKVSADPTLPAAVGKTLDARSVGVEHGKGALPAAEEQKEDSDSPWDSETDAKGQGKVSADLTLPAAVSRSLDARSVAVEHGKGALPAAEEQKEDSDSPWDSETDSDGPWDVSKNVLLSAAFGNRLDARAVLVRSGKGALPAAEEQKEDNDSPRNTKTDSEGPEESVLLPAAVGKTLDARSVAVEHGKGALTAADEQMEDNDSPWDSEVPALEEAVRSRWINGFWAPFPLLLLLPHACTLDLDMPVLQTKCSTDSEGPEESVLLPAAVGKTLDARSVAVEHGKGVLPAAAEERKDNKDFSWGDDDISWLLETDSKGQGKVSTNVSLRTAVGKTLDARSVAVEHGKGVLPAAGEDQKEDNDFSWGDDDISWLLETDSKGQGKVSTNLTLPAAVGKTLDARSVAVEHGKGVLPAAEEEQKEDNDFSWEDDDFSWLLETDSKGQGKASTNLTLHAAVGKSLDARSVAVEHGKGALPAAEEQKEDSDSPRDTETDSKGQGKVSTNLTLPAAVGKTLDARSVAVEHGKGVLPAAEEEQKEDNDFSWEDDDFSWLLETDSKGQGKASTNLTLHAAVGKSLDARSVAVEHGKGVLPAAEEEQKDNKDFSWEDDDFFWLLEVAVVEGAMSFFWIHGVWAPFPLLLLLPHACTLGLDMSVLQTKCSTDCKGQGKASTNLTLHAAVGKSLDARSVAVEHGKGVLPAAGAEQKEDSDSPWDSEVAALEEAVRSRWINGVWAPFPLLLLLPHACTLDLDMPVLQTKCSVNAGTK
ncbi:uncharacterized protein LOC135409465 isoform X2 [Pseudopipra pipra]|uniref:uncharacterized protein LOC135409465 isoform X2 n=1 Tax=Pseudopipra pipra TaxID=415032 RepID=UPI003138C91D